MKKTYESPSLAVIAMQTEEIVTASPEEGFDINVDFDSLWGNTL